jgi:hypothetical protein
MLIWAIIVGNEQKQQSQSKALSPEYFGVFRFHSKILKSTSINLANCYNQQKSLVVMES